MMAKCCPCDSMVARSALALLFISGMCPAQAQRSSDCDRLKEKTINISVHQESGGAYEYKNGGVTYAGSLGEVYVGHITSHRGNVLSALRFAGVHVQKRAVVSSARVHLVDAHTGMECCQGTDLTVLIQLEHTAHSTPLPGHSVNGWLLSSLPATAAVPWRPPVTQTYNVTVTPDLRELVQTVVGMDEWVSGNAVTVLLNSEGGVAEVDERVYFGSGGLKGQQAKLEIKFCEPEPPSEIEAPIEAEAKKTPCPPTPTCPSCPSRSTATEEEMVVMDSTFPAPESASRRTLAAVLLAGICCSLGMMMRTVLRRRRVHSTIDEASQLCTVTPDHDTPYQD